MPFLTLEYSDNIIEIEKMTACFQQIHAQLAEDLKIPLTGFFSSAVKKSHYCVGNDAVNSGFIHVDFKLMRGRTPEVLQSIAQSILDILKNFFAESARKFQLRITLEITELQRTPVKEGYTLSNRLPLSLVF